jgi:peptide/nickel transport system substrate-binding protein
MKNKLLFSLLIMVLLALPMFSACGPAPVTAFTVGYAGTQMTSIDPCDFFSGAPPGVYDTLVGFDENNKMVGHMAESWNLSADGKTLEFKLKNIKFSTGDPFTADDVVFSVARNKEKNMPVAAQLTQNYSGVVAVDDHTVRFTFPAANVQFLPQTCAMMNITSKAYYDRVGEDAYLKRPASSGPYKIVDWKEGQYIDVAYNENYWGKKPQIQNARFLAAFDQSTRVAMLQAGEVDMITQVTGANIAALQKAGFARVDIPQAHDIVIHFDLLSPNTPWSNLKVRQAINYAIDKNSIINTILGGSAQEALWLLPWELGYDPSLKPAYPYDLTKAKDLMKEAGYEKGFDLPLAYPTWMEWSKDLADYLASALKQININVKLTGVSDMPHFMPMVAEIHNNYVAGKPTTPMCFLFDTGWPGNPEPVINLTNGFYMEKDNTLYDNKEVYALIKQALGTVDNAARAKLIKQAYAIINNDLPFVPIVLEVATSMMKSNIEYVPSIGGMTAGPANLIDLRVK